VNLYIKVSKILYQWILLLNSFCFCETWYLHFTTRVFGHSAITPFLGGNLSEARFICGDPIIHIHMKRSRMSHERKSHKWVTNERVMFRVSNEARFICGDLYLNVVVYMWRPRTKESQMKESRTLNLSEARFICGDSCSYVAIYMWKWGANA